VVSSLVCPSHRPLLIVPLLPPQFLLNAQDIANLAWAYATLGILREELMNTLATIGCTPQVMQTFTSQVRPSYIICHTDGTRRLKAEVSEHH
jgi:hypothetical protein